MITFLLDADGRHAVSFLADSSVLKASIIQFHSSHTTSKSKLSRMCSWSKQTLYYWRVGSENVLVIGDNQ